ncbi:unnamed protein product [Gongylonema pulchrum]|uniref:Glycosyltransferase family 92 protein n=1 Tax=Gongylonema pulchrum TaxID=637853 RepID=A0A3P6PDF5_9BILA|nr:unnamed protein product [Gongylonema pulchrum]
MHSAAILSSRLDACCAVLRGTLFQTLCDASASFKMNTTRISSAIAQLKSNGSNDSLIPHEKQIVIMKKRGWGYYICFFSVGECFTCKASAMLLQIWIVQGVTKFYVYIQSLAPEVDALLRVYENDSTIDVERVPWSAFPTEGDYYSKTENDPNHRTWRLEVIVKLQIENNQWDEITNAEEFNFNALSNVSVQKCVYQRDERSKV